MNSLSHIAEFREILSGYAMSEHAKQVLAAVNLVLLVGPSSAGRNTIIRRLVAEGDYRFVISDTTRQKRMNDGVMEQNGVEYWFRPEEDILQDLRDGEFLEAAIIHNQQVSGISIRELEAITNAHKIAINEVEVFGSANVHAAKPSTRIFFVVPPSFEVWIERARGRGELPPDELRRRLESAKMEYEFALGHDFYTFVINDDLEMAVQKIDQAVKSGTYSDEDNASGRLVTQKLLDATTEYLVA